MGNNPLYIIREYQPEDKNFIYASFLRGLYYGDSWFSLIKKDVFMLQYHKVLDWLFSQNDTQIKIACLKEDKDVLLGYSMFKQADKGTTLHYVFVKNAWRRNGIAKNLVPNDVVTVTHLTKVGKIIKPDSVEFNPFLT